MAQCFFATNCFYTCFKVCFHSSAIAFETPLSGEYSTMGLIVVEPTLSGIHDMERALGLLNHFKIPSLVCVNKYDLNEENTSKIVEFCESSGVEVVGKIPFDPIVTEAMVAGKTIVEYSPESTVSKAIEEMWKRTLEKI